MPMPSNARRSAASCHMSAPDISVVIPCYNAGANITRLLEQLGAQSIPRDRYEIIVIDDGSTDDTAARVEAIKNVQLLKQKQCGPGAARNLGVEKSRGRLVLFVDSDLEVAEDLLQRHLGFHDAHPDIALTGGGVEPPKKLPVLSWVLADHFASWFNVHPKVRYPDEPEYLPSLNMCIKKDLVAGKHGLTFPDGLKHTGEDVLYCHALRAKGLKLAFLPNAIVRHHDRTTMADHLNHMYRWGHHAPFVRGALRDLKFGFLFPRNPLLTPFTGPLIVAGYTWLIWKSWLSSRPIAVTLALPQILLGRAVYARGVLHGTMERWRRG